MTRLAVLDPTPRADQPMTRSGSTLVFNGEIYNFRELRTELEQLGHAFSTSGDTEVVLMALLQWGLDALPRLAGMFALGWWSQSTLALCRDEHGIKPLYWRAGADGFISFASESRVLRPTDRGLSTGALQDFLAFGSPVGSVVHEGVRELPPGTALQIRAKSVHQQRWVPVGRPASSPPAEACASAVTSHMESDRPVALFLSGGFDSALLAAHVAGADGPRPIAVTLQTGENGADVEGAERTAKHYGLEHHKHFVDVERLPELVQGYVAAQDQPTLDGFNTYLVSHVARAAGCVVALSGLGGDEVLGGYSYHRHGAKERIAKVLPPRLAAAAAPLLARVLRRPVTSVTAHLGARGAVARFLASRQVFSPQEVRALTGTVPVPQLGLRDDPSLTERLQLARLDFDVYLRSTLLRDCDVFSMHHGLELRVPLLSPSFVRSTLNLARPVTKSGLAEALRDPYLQELAEAPKMTFSLPWGQWLTALRPAVAGLLDRPQPWRGHLDPAVALPLASHVDVNQNWLRPWALVVLALWLEHNKVVAV